MKTRKKYDIEDAPPKWSEWIKDNWPFELPEHLMKFGVLVHYLRFRFDFDYEDTRVYVERALGRPMHAGEFEEMMRAWENSVADMVR